MAAALHWVPSALISAALGEYRRRHCWPDCPRCVSPEGTMQCSQDAMWSAFARIRLRLHEGAGNAGATAPGT